MRIGPLRYAPAVVLFGAILAAVFPLSASLAQGPDLERTCFQTGRAYSDRLDLRADVAIVYGIGKDMPERVESWRKRGYRVHLMTGVAWGEYQDYLYGRFDGLSHEDEAQTRRDGSKISHGGDVYYMSPGPDYGKFLCVGVKRALDAGVDAVHLEEPEYWADGGYNEAFKRDWRAYYGEPWQAQDSSPDARWRSSKLKYFLYRRALQQVFDFIGAYNQAHHASVKCYVPTHSLINYATWGIVSPESSLARLTGCDGYIAQVWTGTARQPNVYRGKREERTFETAFLEYGAMMNLVRATGRKVWFLADPVEDNPDHDWGDYRRNWEATLTASLLHPDVADYEIMPWPERIYTGKYPSADNHKELVPIPPSYATELANVTHALKEMQGQRLEWRSGMQGIGVVVSDSLMFERGEPSGSDPDLGNFFGLAMPFVKAGIPIEPVQLESVGLPHYLDRYRLLLMTYRGQKPLTPDVHPPLAAWVRAGGTLVFVDDDGDPYNHIREWWNDGGKDPSIPRQKLFELLEMGDSAGRKRVGKGSVVFIRQDPAALASAPDGPDVLLNAAKGAIGRAWKTEDGFAVRRGAYFISHGKAIRQPPLAVDLFDPDLKLLKEPDETRLCHFLVDLGSFPASRTSYVAGPDVRDEKGSRAGWSGVIEGPSGVNAVVLLKVAQSPRSVALDDRELSTWTYDAAHHLLWIRFAMTAQPQRVAVSLK